MVSLQIKTDKLDCFRIRLALTDSVPKLFDLIAQHLQFSSLSKIPHSNLLLFFHGTRIRVDDPMIMASFHFKEDDILAVIVRATSQEPMEVLKDNGLKDNGLKDNELKNNGLKDNELKNNELKDNDLLTETKKEELLLQLGFTQNDVQLSLRNCGKDLHKSAAYLFQL